MGEEKLPVKSGSASGYLELLGATTFDLNKRILSGRATNTLVHH